MAGLRVMSGHALAVGALDVVVDGGVDDALALAVLVASKAPLRQVTANEGSVGVDVVAATTARLMRLLGGDAPVAVGEAHGLAGSYPAGRDPFHGEDAFGGHAHLLPEASPTGDWERLGGDVLVTGAMTVVAAAVQQGHPVERVWWMGGSVAAGGNMTAAAEFNAWMDPAAVDAVLRSPVETRIVPLDVTVECTMGKAEVDQIASSAPVGAALGAAIATLLDRDGFFIPHDAVAAVAVLYPDLFGWTARHVRCETEGTLTTGALIVDRRALSPAPNALVAESVQADAVVDQILRSVG